MKDAAKFSSLSEVENRTRECERCRLSVGRTKAVPGEGPRKAELMFIGEAPGGDEDLSGRPFVGRAGRLLEEALVEADIKRGDVYVTNIVKCRPPDNRQPKDDEMDSCQDFLQAQIEFVDPVIVCTLGAIALKRILGKKGITSYRGRVVRRLGRSFVPTFHPAGALRNPQLKPYLFSDIKEIRRLITSREAYEQDAMDSTLF